MASLAPWHGSSDLARVVIVRGVLAVSLATIALLVGTAPAAANEPLSTTVSTETAAEPLVETTDATLEPVVENADQTLGTTSSAFEPIVDTVEPVLEPIVGTAEPIVDTVEPVLEPIVGTAEPIVDTLEPVLGPIVGTAEPIVVTLEPVLEPIVNIGLRVDAAPTTMLRVVLIDYASSNTASDSSTRDPAASGVAFVGQTHRRGDPAATSVVLGQRAVSVPAAGTSAWMHTIVPVTGSPSLTLDSSAVAAALTAATALLGLLAARLYSTTYLLPTGRRALVPVPPG